MDPDHATLTTCGFVFLFLDWIFNNTCPGINWIFVILLGSRPHLPKPPANIWILDSNWTIFIPRETCSSRASPRFISWNVCTTRWVVSCLVFPSDYPLLNIHVPTTRTGTVNPVGRPDHFIVGPTLPIEFFPTPIMFFELGEGTVKLFNFIEKA